MHTEGLSKLPTVSSLFRIRVTGKEEKPTHDYFKHFHLILEDPLSLLYCYTLNSLLKLYLTFPEKDLER